MGWFSKLLQAFGGKHNENDHENSGPPDGGRLAPGLDLAVGVGRGNSWHPVADAGRSAGHADGSTGRAFGGSIRNQPIQSGDVDRPVVFGRSPDPSAASGPVQRGLIDRAAFFAQCRAHIFGGRLDQSQVDGLEAILSRWECGRDDDMRWLAYALGTTMHETARTMRPIREYGGADYFFRMYDPLSPNTRRAALSQANGQRPGDGVRFYGRGYVQLTWRPNYLRAGQKLGIDLVGNPDLALHPAHAADIMFIGMREGWFTGKALSHYFDGDRADWVSARRIINGMDCAESIAALARGFYVALGRSS